MKTSHRLVALLCTTAALISLAHAAAIDGKWKAEFDTAIGVQKYVFELKADGDKLTGTAHSERQDGSKSATAITEGKVAKDGVSFVEPLKLQDFDLRIEYSGKLEGDNLKLTRKVGDFGTEELVAKRVNDTGK